LALKSECILKIKILRNYLAPIERLSATIRHSQQLGCEIAIQKTGVSVNLMFMSSLLSIWHRLFRPSHRTAAEQIVGLGIFLLFCCSFGIVQSSIVYGFKLFWTVYFLLQGLGMWTLWRRYSLRVITLEFSLFYAQFVLQAAWMITLFGFQHPLLAVAILLLHLSNTLVATLLFWKKERLSGQILCLPLLWVFFLMGQSLITCILNP
jgi:tryptophan-rich sensory protein